MRQPNSASATAAFSFGEFLVVLAVLTLLAALVLPLMNRARSHTRQTQCTVNLGQVGKAILQYADDNKGVLPAVTNSKPPGGWWWYKEQVKKYAGLSGASSANDRVFGCPSDRGYEEEGKVVPFRTRAKYDFTSYVFNGVNLPGVPNIASRSTMSIKEPARTLLVMEWSAHAPLSWHKSRTGEANAPFYSDAESVVTFVDGHTKLIKIYYDGINAAYTRDPIPGYAYKYSGD